MAATRIIDLSHTITVDIPMFPGLPAPVTEEILTREASESHYDEGTSFLIQRYSITGNSGTYMDVPFHRYEKGADLATLALRYTVDLPGVVINVSHEVVSGKRAISASDIPDELPVGAAVLFRTGWDQLWPADDYLDPNPHLTDDAAARLLELGAVLIGIDTWNIDDTGNMARPVHSRLLRAGIPIVENLCNLGSLPWSGFRFHAAPLPIAGGTATPVRAYAIIQG